MNKFMLLATASFLALALCGSGEESTVTNSTQVEQNYSGDPVESNLVGNDWVSSNNQ